VLVAWLLLAESLAVTHALDLAAHSEGQPCAVCLGAASFGSAAPPTIATFAPIVAALAVAIVTVVALATIVPTRRYARGPPRVSFKF
jgi:hypothetical protein